MDFKMSNEPAPEKGKQNMLLVVLLILVAAFAYLYFFTGLIKPQEAQKPAETPAPQVVKMPLPPRNGQPAAGAPAGAPVPAGASAGAPGAQKNAVASAKPQSQKAEVDELLGEPQKAEPAKPAKAAVSEKKGAAPEAKEPKATAVAKQQPATAAKKPAAAKENDKAAKAAGMAQNGAPAGTAKKTTPPAADKERAKAVPAKGNGPWTVVVGSYVLEDTMASDLMRVRGAGLEAAIQEGGRKKTAMKRLLAGEYPSRAEAQEALETLKLHTSDAFILEQGDKFVVYAGSYVLTARADSEKERLAADGIKLTIKQAQVSIPAKSLTAGTFSDKNAADAALKKLKALGFKATLSQK